MSPGFHGVSEVLVGRRRRGLDRLFVCFLACALLAGCGDDDEPAAPREPAARSETAATVETTATQTTPKRRESPEQQEGGAGDEIPARSLAMLTGSGGRITPPLVRVPPFIAIRVELRSDDGRPYRLDFDGKRLRADADTPSMSTTLDGLRPGRAYESTPAGVRIEASAEPGP